MSNQLAFADDQASAWIAEPQLYLAGISQIRKTHGLSDTRQSVLTAAELKFRSETHRWTASLFAEYQFSRDDQFDDIVNLGGFIKYQLGNWDTATYLFAETSSGHSESWIYAGRVRYRLAENHKVGMQAAGALDTSISPPVAFGYYGSISDSLSVNIIADPGINGAVKFAARMELVWQLR